MTEDISVTKFRQFLRIATVQPNPDYGPAIEFLCALADDVGLQHRIVRVLPDKPVVIMTWPGKDPSLASVVLNSHTDVVPVFREYWKYPPFSAHKDEDGNIYARGAQDMKCTAIQYVEAIRRLKKTGIRCLRTVHLTFVPDEETGGHTGMALFVKMPEFKALNLGLILDEGIASEDDTYKIHYAERVKWHLKVTCTGNPGHGSKFIENTAAEKMQKVINKFLKFREEQERLLASEPGLSEGNVTTLNLTILRGGVQVNVVPAEFVLEFDIRASPLADYKSLTEQFESWVKESGANFEWIDRVLIKAMTAVDDSSPWWKAFSGTFRNLGLKYTTEIDIGATDSRYLRELGYPAYGFSAIVNTPQLLHDHDEYLNEAVYLKGVEIYTHLIPALANVPPS